MASEPNESFHGVSHPATADAEDTTALKEKAERCRRLAAGISDDRAADVLRTMARNYEESASRGSHAD